MRLACLAAFGNVPVGADAPWPSGTESSHGARLEVTILTLNSVCRWPARTVDLRGKQKCVFFFGTQKRAVCSEGNCLPLLEHFSVLTSVKPARRPALLSALDDARSTLSGPELREFDLAQMQAGLTRRSKPSALSENNHQSPSTLPVSSGAAVGPSGWGEPEDAVRNPAAQVYRKQRIGRSPESDREQLPFKLDSFRQETHDGQPWCVRSIVFVVSHLSVENGCRETGGKERKPYQSQTVQLLRFSCLPYKSGLSLKC